QSQIALFQRYLPRAPLLLPELFAARLPQLRRIAVLQRGAILGDLIHRGALRKHRRYRDYRQKRDEPATAARKIRHVCPQWIGRRGIIVAGIAPPLITRGGRSRVIFAAWRETR